MSICLFMDRSDKADDNAEHLYRYAQKHLQLKCVYFILERSSKDWNRLRSESFNLVEYQSLKHLWLLLRADYYLSSHLPKYHGMLIHKKILKKLVHFKVVFLQHGITHNDISDILNRHKIDYLTTASQKEYNNFIEDSNYKIDKSSVILTGFSRFDSFFSNHKESVDNTILIMPTWRASFSSHSLEDKEIFKESIYYREWSSLLNSREFENMVKRYGYSVLFTPHPEMDSLIDDIKIPTYIDLISSKKSQLQKYLISSKILITDYSSVAFDMAIQKRALCYFQFDKDSFFNTSHLYKKSYFDYEADGFGDVCYSLNSLLFSIENILENDGESNIKYTKRVDGFFEYFDEFNSKRIIDAIGC